MKQHNSRRLSPDSVPDNLSRQNSPALYPQRVQLSRASRSIRLGALLYFAAHNTLESGQREWIARFQSRLNLDEIQKAISFMHLLTTNPRARARFEGQFQIRVPFSGPRPKRPEQRRIGVGYRDKGSLREIHRPALPGEPTLGFEASLLYGSSSQPDWILQGERLGQTEVLSTRRENLQGYKSSVLKPEEVIKKNTMMLNIWCSLEPPF